MTYARSFANKIPTNKVIILGSQGVGKSSLIKSFLYEIFDDSYQPTVGIEFVTTTMHSSQRYVRLQMWDTAGQERFYSILPSYVRDSILTIIVYDITNPLSFRQASRWIDVIRAEEHREVKIMLVGNKTDICEERQITTDEGERTSKAKNVMFIETSAKTRSNVKQMFELARQTLIEQQIKMEIKKPELKVVQSPTNWQCYACCKRLF